MFSFFKKTVVKKIEITIGNLFIFWMGCLCIIFIFFVEKIPGLEALVEKLMDSISGKPFPKTHQATHS